MTNTLFTIKWRPATFCNSQIHVSNTVSLYFILFPLYKDFLFTPYKMVFTEGLLYFLRTSWWQEPQMVLQMKKKIPKSQRQNLHQWSATTCTFSVPGQMSSFLNLSSVPQDLGFPRAEHAHVCKDLYKWWSPIPELLKGIWKHINCIETSLKRYYHKKTIH